jgi:hypothetical protein
MAVSPNPVVLSPFVFAAPPPPITIEYAVFGVTVFADPLGVFGVPDAFVDVSAP